MNDSPKYKATLRVPTAEQYAYIELHLEDTLEALHEAYNAATGMFKHGDGLPDSEFDHFIQKQISGEPNMMSDFNRMSPEQQKYVGIIKRAVKRINYKLNKDV